MSKIDTATIEKYQSILAKDPNSQAFAPLADAYLEMGMLKEAESLARNGVKRHPQLAGGYVVLGKILRAQENFVDAITALRKAIEIAPTNILAQQTLGEIYFEEREAKEALKCFKMVLFLNPNAQRARKIVQKLESVTADEFSEEAFEMTPLQNLRTDVSSSGGEKTTVGIPEHTMVASLIEAKNPDDPKLQMDRALQRVLSLVDALIVRNELGKAQFMLQDCFKEFGNHPELVMRSKALLMRSNPNIEESGIIETATSLKPLASREKLANQRKLEVLHLLLRKIEDARI